MLSLLLASITSLSGPQVCCYLPSFRILEKQAASHYHFGKVKGSPGQQRQQSPGLGGRGEREGEGDKGEGGAEVSMPRQVPVTFLNWNLFIRKNGSTVNFLGGL